MKLIMEIFVASTSECKLEAVKNASKEMYPDVVVNVHGRKASSGINEQPVGHEETVQGALNRLKSLKDIIGQTRYDLLVAFENGIFAVTIGGQETWFDLGWVVVEDVDGNQAFACSTGMEFPVGDVEEARQRGFSRSTVGSVIAERTGADSADPHSYLTKQTVTRADMLGQSLKTALGQILFRDDRKL